MRAGVSSTRSRRRARYSGVGRHSAYASRTASGISISGSTETSCAMRYPGKIGVRSSGPAGCMVAGLSGGVGSPGRSGSRFTQCVGISDSGRRYFTVSSLMAPELNSRQRAILARVWGRPVGLATAACCLALAAPAAAQTPERALIAYEVSVSEGHSETYLVRSDGSARRRLTGSSPSLPGRPSNVDPAWAPDGTRLAYTRGPESRNGTTQIRVRDVARGTDQALAAGADGYAPAWSPDGTRIAFLRQAPDRQEATLYVMSADGSGTAVKIADNAAEPEWAPDGRRILFSRAFLTST